MENDEQEHPIQLVIVALLNTGAAEADAEDDHLSREI